MARKKSSPTVAWDQPRFAGNTFAFAGKWGRWEAEYIEKLIAMEGGAVVAEVTPALDFLALGQVSGKTTLAGKKAEKLNAAGEAKIRILIQQQVWDLFAPDRSLTEALLRAGPPAADRLRLLLGGPRRAAIDLSGADLRGAQFPERLGLHNVNLTGADLRKADLTRVWMQELRGARLDGAQLPGFYLRKLSDCQLVGADLPGIRMYNGEIERCDLTRANLENASLTNLKTTAVVFQGARMSRINLEKAHLSGANLSEADMSKARLGECDLSGANLAGADLSEADLTRANLKGADLRNARLRTAILSDADLTDARIEGADFEGANLAGAKLDGLDLTRARGLDAGQAAGLPSAGPHLQELDQVVAQTARLVSSAAIELPDGTSIPVSFQTSNSAKSILLISPKRNRWQQVPVASLSAGLLDLVRPYLHGSLRLDSIKTTGTGGPRKPKALRRLVLAAWCESCGRSVPAEDEVEAEAAAAQERTQERQEGIIQDLRRGARGVKRWNALSDAERKQAGPFKGIDLSGAQLDEVNFAGLDFSDANFEKASLVGAIFGGHGMRLSKVRFREARLDRATFCLRSFATVSFVGASLREANLRSCNGRGGCFKGTALTGADLSFANLAGTDLSTATLTDAKFERAEFDEQTLFPSGFELPRQMIWRGKGQDPRWQRPTVAATPVPAAESLTVEQFMTLLRGKVDGGRLANALQMLKAERFHLFSQVEEGSLVGVVKSQSSAERVYSCRLAADGSFSCCTQNLRICGGLAGAICKHLLVLIVGLANSGKVNLGAVDQWISSSRGQRPVMDHEGASAVFLRYKGAEAGEVDWRPTETIPEDFYAF